MTLFIFLNIIIIYILFKQLYIQNPIFLNYKSNLLFIFISFNDDKIIQFYLYPKIYYS
jgi:hypothetical protein